MSRATNMLLVVAISFSSVMATPVMASPRDGSNKKAIYVAGALVLLGLLSGNHGSVAPAPRTLPTQIGPVQPVRVGNLGTIRVEAGTISWSGDASAIEQMMTACGRVGFKPIDPQARQIAEEEAQRLGGEAQLPPAKYVGFVSVSQEEGMSQRTEENYRNSGSSGSIEVEWARVTFRVYEDGVQVAVATDRASDAQAASSSYYSGWSYGSETQTNQPSRIDLAIEAACQKVANSVARQLAPSAPDRNFNPQTGERISSQPAGWNFDPVTGKRLGQTNNLNSASAPVGASNQFDPGDPAR